MHAWVLYELCDFGAGNLPVSPEPQLIHLETGIIPTHFQTSTEPNDDPDTGICE